MLITIMLTGICWADDKTQATTDRLDKSAEVLNQIMAAPDEGTPEDVQRVIEHAKCVAVVPHMIKGGFVFGAQGGRGVVSCRTSAGSWSAPAFFAISGGNWGLQLGVEGVDLLIVVQNDKGMEQMLSGKFQLGADASVAAGPVDRHASADTDWNMMNAEFLIYSRAKGAFAGLAMSGVDVRPDEDSMRTVYGRDVTTRAVLEGSVPPPAQAHDFLNAIPQRKINKAASR
jgi:lipid-binding SYLF domain-containing protein